MITKFDSSYYGTADMESLGYAGTPINERRYSKEQLANALHKVVSYAKCMDERGYNTLWMAEHHFQPEGTELIPNLLMMAMHLVNVTKTLKIGCGFNVVPAPERFPVECWQPIQSGSDRAFDFMAKHGINGVIGGGSAEGGAVERHMIGFQAAYARRGIQLELGERLALGFQFHIAKSREQAMREAAKHYEENMKMFGELRLVRALSDEQIAAMRDPKLAATTKLPRIEDAVKAGGFLAGTPADIIEQLKAIEKRYPGIDRVVCATPLGTPLEVQLEDLDRFAKEVMPAFREAKIAAAAE